MADDLHIVSTEFPYIPIRVTLPGWEVEVMALLDTGFTGEFIIPRNVLPQDIVVPAEYIEVEVADTGSFRHLCTPDDWK